MRLIALFPLLLALFASEADAASVASTPRASYCLGVELARLQLMMDSGVGSAAEIERARHEAQRLYAFVRPRLEAGGARAGLAAFEQGLRDFAQQQRDLTSGCHGSDAACLNWLERNSASYRAIQSCGLDNGVPY